MIRKFAFVCFSVALIGCQNDNTTTTGESTPIEDPTTKETPKKNKKVKIISAEEAAKNYRFKSHHLVGSWLCEWIDDPKGVGSQYVYRFYADGTYATFFPGKETNEGVWHVIEDKDGPWVVFETKASVDHKLNTTSKGLIRVNKKDDFEIHSFLRDGGVIADNKLQFTRYVPGTVPELEVVEG